MIPNRSRASTSRSRRAVPERDGEHPAQPLEAGGAELLVEVRDHLDVAVPPEAVPARLELGAQLDVVVDLPVADADDLAGLVGDRLVAGLEVDDREPPHRERDRAGREAPLAVRAAVPHQLDRVERLGRRPAPRRGDAEDPAHEG